MAPENQSQQPLEASPARLPCLAEWLEYDGRSRCAGSQQTYHVADDKVGLDRAVGAHDAQVRLYRACPQRHDQAGEGVTSSDDRPDFAFRRHVQCGELGRAARRQCIEQQVHRVRQDVDELLDRGAKPAAARTASHGLERKEAFHVPDVTDHGYVLAIGLRGVLEKHLVGGAGPQSFGGGQVQDRLGVCRCQRKWLLHIDMRACLQAGPGKIRVGVWRRHDVNDIRLGRGQHGRQVGERSDIRAEPRLDLCSGDCRIDHCDQFGAIAMPDRSSVLNGHLARTEQGDTKSMCHICCRSNVGVQPLMLQAVKGLAVTQECDSIRIQRSAAFVI